jgi:hypothetical protein
MTAFRALLVLILLAFGLSLSSAFAVAADEPIKAKPKSSKAADRALIANARSAAPRAVSAKATVVTMDEKGKMRVLVKGTNQFTCMPDNPVSPGTDPMCLDANGMVWAMAWLAHQSPPPGQVGIGYMLKGGSDASNTDPYATTPAEGHAWVDTGPHIMILGAPSLTATYPKQQDNPDTLQPYVMFAGTPYEHLMVPIRAPAPAAKSN